ncbi:MAG: translocation/assembly module TamB [Chitinophagaceae bacterium]|nr:translocation/assembly module TamB [Chitinophagaceae bacterium]
MLRRIVKILSRVLLILLLLLITVWALIHLKPVQNWLVKQAARKLSKELNTEVTVKHVDFSLFNKMLLEGVMIKDRNKDTLLYTGVTKVNITDWFFVKEKADLHYVGLEQTTVYLHRKDSVWNYQFLVDYFSSPSTGSKKKGMQLSLEQLELKNLHLLQKDEWVGKNQEASVSYLNLSVKKFDVTNKQIDISELVLEKPFFSIDDYDGLRPEGKNIPDAEYHKNDTIEKWNDGGWLITASKIKISDGEFKNNRKTERSPYTYFDGAHLRFYAINGEFSNLQLKGDTLQTHLTLATKERSGFKVNKLNADVLFHPTGMEFKNMLIETPNSRLADYFAMRFTHFNHDMSDFISHVRLEGNFNKSKVHSDDIAFFAPELKDWKDVIYISGKAKGTIGHLKGDSIHITTARNTLFEGKFVMDGLPGINTTFLDITATKFKTTYADASQIYPGLKSIKTPAISKISYLNYSGSFTGYLRDFVTYGTTETNLGTVTTDLNLKLPPGKDPIYSGKLKTNGFALGEILNEKNIGRIVMEGSLKGRGFNTNTLFAEIDGQIKEFEVRGYNYHNIIAKGIVEQKKFDGALAITDSNIRVNLTGIVDFGKDTPVYKLNGNVYKLRFKPLGFAKQDLFFSGLIDFNFRVKTIEDFMGTAIVQNAELKDGDRKLSFDSLYLSNHYINDTTKQFILRSNEIDAKLRGNYNLVYLPDVTLGFLHNYFPSYIPEPRKKIAVQSFDFDITTNNISQFISLLNAPVSGFDQSTIKGSINIQQNKFNLNTYVPNFKYNGIAFDNVNITGTGNFTNLSLQGNIGEIKINDSLRLPNTNFVAVASNDTGSFSIKTSANQTLKDADLRAKFIASKDGFTINFQPSALVINEKHWAIQDESDLFIGGGQLVSNGLRFNSGNEEIFLYTQPCATCSSGNDLVVELKKLQAGDIVPYFLKDPRLEGSVTGRIDIINPLGKFNVDAELKADQFRFNNDSLGKVEIKGNYSSENKIINYNIASENEGHEFVINGNTNINDLKNVTTDNIITIENEKLGLLNKYLSVIMTDMKGTGKGILRVKGKGEQPDIIGKVTLNNTSFVLDYTKCRYFIENGTTIEFKEGAIDFGSIKLKDTTGRTATFSGQLFHQFFRDMAFDMEFRADDQRKGFVVLNTTKKDNNLFYGSVIANASGSILGPQNKIELTLRGTPTDSSKLYLPTSDTRVTGTADFIVFRKYGKEMKPEIDIKEATSLNVDLTVTANPLAKVFLILDEQTNDIIEGQGNGTINLKVGTNEKTTMTGNFQITKGLYTFNWQYLVRKPFLINNGTINWNGDPYDAQINIDANYFVERVRLLPELTTGCSNEPSGLTVISNLSNTLKNPIIKFRFELPPGHPCKNNPLTQTALAQLYNNEDELNRQVISLLLFRSFISTQQGNSISNNLLGAAGTLTEFIAQQATKGINGVLKSIPGFRELKLDSYVTFNPSLSSGAQLEGSASAGFTKNLLNGRIVLRAGGSVLVTSGQQTALTNGGNVLTPDISVEWLITRDGKLRLISFYRTVFDIQRRSDRTGLSLSFSRERDKFWDLFRREKKVTDEFDLFNN